MNVQSRDITVGGSIHGPFNSFNTTNIVYSEPQSVTLAEWVSGLDFSLDQSQAFERYTEGTLHWVLQEPEFVNWLRQGGMLWLPGKPGAGKTVLVSFIVDFLQNLPNREPTPAVCYVYCRYDSTPSTLQFFEAILKQLLRCPSANMERVQAARNRGQRLALKEILSILQENLDHLGNVFILVDALDECFEEPTRHQVLLHLRSLTSVSILITSRLLPIIESAMDGVSKLVISTRSQDIKTYFRAQTKLSPRLGKLSETDYQHIEATVINNSGGMFLLAHLHIADLARQINKTQLFHALGRLPKEAPTTYEATLQRIRQRDENERQLAFHTLSWILYALRPLSLLELRHALAIHNLERMAKQADLTDEEVIISSCAGLIVVNRTRIGRAARVTFLHYTVREFLQQARMAPELLSESAIVTDSLKLMSFPGLNLNYPLVKYATETDAWGRLVRKYEHEESVLKLALHQLTSDPTVRILGFGKASLRGATAIHLVAAYGLVKTGEAFIRTHRQIATAFMNVKDVQGRTPLSLAARNGHSAAVKLLLEFQQVDVNSRDQWGQTPLFYAVQNKHPQVVKMLLQHPDVDVNSKNGFGLTPLSYVWGSTAEYIQVVDLLLGHPSVNANSKDGQGRTLLCYAAQHGSLELVQLVLEHPDVDLNAEDDHLRTPLSYAASNGDLAIVKLLLNHPNIAINSKSNRGQVALTHAVLNGHLEITKALVQHPATDINFQDDFDRAPLSYAAKKGHLDIVRVLVGHPNVDVNVRDMFGRTPLFSAAENGCLEIVATLLAHINVQVNAAEVESGRTPLMEAALKGHLDVLEVLLEHDGINVNAKDCQGRTALCFAVLGGLEELVKALVQHPGIDFSSKDYFLTQ